MKNNYELTVYPWNAAQYTIKVTATRNVATAYAITELKKLNLEAEIHVVNLDENTIQTVGSFKKQEA